MRAHHPVPPFQPLFTRYPWLGPATLACVIAAWALLDRYLEITP